MIVTVQGKVYKMVVILAMMYDFETEALTKRQEAKVKRDSS